MANTNYNTSKIVLIYTDTSEVIIFSSKGTLADYLNVPRETVVNWFRDSNRVIRSNYIIYKATKEYFKQYPGRPDRKGQFSK